MQEMNVVAVGVDQAKMQPLLLLQEVSGQRRLLPIWIGLPEASAIELERQHAATRRPMTHQLLGQIVGSFGRRVAEVCLTSLREELFHAELIFDSGVRVSSRASDAVAIALHLDIPIQAEDAVLDEAGLTDVQLYGEDEPLEPSQAEPLEPSQAEEVETFRRFLDSASPEDFDTN